MTPQQIVLVKSSWQQVLPIKDTAADLFYNQLFTLDPSLKALFKGDLKEQGRKLMTMISVAVNALDKLETIVPVVQDLGRRHAGYGVKDPHYETVATALLWTLGKGLGDGFTSDVKQAWVAAYTILADTMKQSARAA